MTPRRRWLTSGLLLAFAVWDAVLAAVAILVPDLWFQHFHGVPREDPQALLARTGAIWFAFALFHLIAFRAWHARPYWLVIVGGMRLGETFADWTYLALAQDVTAAGRIGLLVAGPANLFFALFFIQGYLIRMRAGAAAGEPRPGVPAGGGTP